MQDKTSLTLARPIMLALAACFSTQAAAAPGLASPDHHIQVQVRLTPDHALAYSVSRDGKPVIMTSSLGLQLEGADFEHQLTLAGTTPIKAIQDSYILATGKKSRITYAANEQTYTVRNAQRQNMQVTFRHQRLARARQGRQAVPGAREHASAAVRGGSAERSRPAGKCGERAGADCGRDGR
jgi:hypothetical protein